MLLLVAKYTWEIPAHKSWDKSKTLEKKSQVGQLKLFNYYTIIFIYLELDDFHNECDFNNFQHVRD